MTITNEDLEWLTNINTRPGPGVGEKIDPTKPGPIATPTSADVIEGMREALAACIDYVDEYADVWEQKRVSLGAYEACSRVRNVARAALALPDSKPDKGGA